jgi:hypothetical protein
MAAARLKGNHMSERNPEPADDGQTYSAPPEVRGGNRPEDYMPDPGDYTLPDGRTFEPDFDDEPDDRDDNAKASR